MGREFLIVTTSGGRSVEVTPDCQLLKMTCEGHPKWEKISNIEPGDYVACPRSLPSLSDMKNMSNIAFIVHMKDLIWNKHKKRANVLLNVLSDEETIVCRSGNGHITRLRVPKILSVDENLAKLLAFLYSEGSTSKPHQVHLPQKNYPTIMNDVVTYVEKNFGIKAKLYVDQSCAGMRTAVFYNLLFAEYVSFTFGKTVWNKLLSATEEVRKEFVRCWFTLEGNLTRSGVEFSQKSRLNTNMLANLLLTLHIFPIMGIHHNKKYGIKYHRLSLRGLQVKRFLEIGGMMDDEKNRQLAKYPLITQNYDVVPLTYKQITKVLLKVFKTKSGRARRGICHFRFRDIFRSFNNGGSSRNKHVRPGTFSGIVNALDERLKKLTEIAITGTLKEEMDWFALSQAAIAKKLGIAQQEVSLKMRGKRIPVRFERAVNNECRNRLIEAKANLKVFRQIEQLTENVVWLIVKSKTEKSNNYVDSGSKEKGLGDNWGLCLRNAKFNQHRHATSGRS